VESPGAKSLFASPRHPYTHGLLASIPRLTTEKGARLPAIEGMVPAPVERPAGCAFAQRCPQAQARCRAEQPQLTGEADHRFACFYPVQV
jgi:oligopeptide/dipeptide ABC transporter ATP-binding protein